MGLFAKLMYAFCVHFIIYWVFIQPFIGKLYTYNDAVSYAVGAVLIIVFATTANVYLITALLTDNNWSETKSSIYYVIINMAVADVLQTLIVMPLLLDEKIAYISPQNTIEDLKRIAKLLAVLQYFSMLTGILYAASIAQCCFLSFLRTWYRLPRVSYNMTIQSTQFIWVYSSVLIFTLSSSDYWSEDWHRTYKSMVEFFIPAGISVLSIVALLLIEWRRPLEEQIYEKDIQNKVLYALTVTFFILRGPKSVLSLASLANLPKEADKLKYIFANLYHFKCCINPLLLYIFDKSIQEMYTKLHERVSRLLIRSCRRRGGNKSEQDSSRVNFETSNQSVNVGLTLEEEETELLP